MESEAQKKISELQQSKNRQDSLVEQVKLSRADVNKETQSNLSPRGVENEVLEISEVPTFDTPEAAIANQDVKLREKYIKAVSRDIKSRSKVRRRLLNFYIWFTVGITVCIFWVVIDPIRLLSGRNSFYPISLKLLLCGAFFANLISTIVLMVRYSFAPIDNVMRAFRELGNGDSEND